MPVEPTNPICQFPGCGSVATYQAARHARPVRRLCESSVTARTTPAAWVACHEHRDWAGPVNPGDQ